VRPIDPGTPAPPIRGVEFDGGPVAVVFYKVTCPTCQMAAPVAERLAVANPGRVFGVVQDPEERAVAFAREYRTTFPFATDTEPYTTSNAYGVRTVPTMFVIEKNEVTDVVESWDRDGWNRVAAYLGSAMGTAAEPVSTESDGLPPFRPG
jgi:thiol-disulfide isomerase/thioredoxin